MTEICDGRGVKDPEVGKFGKIFLAIQTKGQIWWKAEG